MDASSWELHLDSMTTFSPEGSTMYDEKKQFGKGQKVVVDSGTSTFFMPESDRKLLVDYIS